MKHFDILWRFVFEAKDQAVAQSAADAVANLLNLTGLDPVHHYKQASWWMTDIVVGATDENLAVVLGRQLALAGRLTPAWSLRAISELDDDGTCFALAVIDADNRPSVAGLTWALLELWERQDIDTPDLP